MQGTGGMLTRGSSLIWAVEAPEAPEAPEAQFQTLAGALPSASTPASRKLRSEVSPVGQPVQ